MNLAHILVPAKINLGLNIVGKRADGYHNLETVFYPIPLYDEISISINPACCKEPQLEIEGTSVPGRTEDNLVVRAYRMLESEFPELPALSFRLIKHIPTQAGMGGGSADASCTLRLINSMFDLGLSEERLEQYAVRLGADCPFFIKAEPAFAQGIGEQLESISLNLSGRYIAIIKPSIAISTKEAFSLVSPKIPKKSCRDIVMQPIETWREELSNDFEVSAFALYPELAAIKQYLYDSGATYAAMSGSGSAMFGIYTNEPDIQSWKYKAIVREL